MAQAFKFQEEQKDKLTAMLQELESFTVASDEMNPKFNPDAMYFEQAVEAINQANKFSQLINT